MNRKRLGIVIFGEIEVLDFCGPFEVFSVTRLDESRRREEPSPFEVFLISQFRQPVTTTGGMTWSIRFQKTMSVGLHYEI